MPARLTHEQFLAKAKLKHKGYYTYPDAQYRTGKDHVLVNCPKHGQFSIMAERHLYGQGCRACGYENNGKALRASFEEFVRDARSKHGEKYDYSKVKDVLQDGRTPVPIICPIHGVFYQKPFHHKQGQGCQACGKIQKALSKQYTFKQFKNLAKRKGQDRYEFIASTYKKYNEPMTMRCPDHGDFKQVPERLIQIGSGCQKCGWENAGKSMRKGNEEFIAKSKELHGDRFTYELTEYVNANQPVTVTCKRHGPIEFPKAYYHYQGWGCRECGLDQSASLGEDLILRSLKKRGVVFERQKTFDGLKMDAALRYDFFLPEHQIAIEFNGEQHYKAVIVFGGEETLKKTQQSDRIKVEFAKNNGMSLEVIRYDEDIEDRLDEILST